MKRIKELILSLTLFEKILWICSVMGVIASYAISGTGEIMTILASVIGLTALIFIAKGMVVGQVLIIIFSLFYGFISFRMRYYGEMITYLGMSAPMAVLALISWMKNPYGETNEVKISRVTKKQITIMLVISVFVTVGFFFILKALNNAKLIVSTFSVLTSFIAAYLTFLRSPFYAIGYACNDLVLIILWVFAAVNDPSYTPMIICFSMFLINDLYGFISWHKRQKHQMMFLKDEI
jgi:nicotinamide mononucleotide transporter PnuC